MATIDFSCMVIRGSVSPHLEGQNVDECEGDVNGLIMGQATVYGQRACPQKLNSTEENKLSLLIRKSVYAALIDLKAAEARAAHPEVGCQSVIVPES